MNKQIFFTVLAAVSLLAMSCASRRTNNQLPVVAENYHSASIIRHNADGSLTETFTLPSVEDESRFRVEFFAGKEMMVDCNLHTLIGQFEERVMSNGEIHLFFNSTGQTISTQMACIDDTRRLAFVAAPPHAMQYNPAAPIVVHAPQGISIRQRIWEAGETRPFPPTPRYANTHVLSAFPREIEGFNRFVLLLPENEDAGREMQVEIIAGKAAYVDCNRIILGGTFSRRMVHGWGFDYLIFNSDGIMVTTRMACLEPARRAFVPANVSEFLRYNNQMPIVVFAPAGFEVRYRIWEAPSM